MVSAPGNQTKPLPWPKQSPLWLWNMQNSSFGHFLAHTLTKLAINIPDTNPEHLWSMQPGLVWIVAERQSNGIFITSVPSLHSMTIFASFQTAWPRSALFTGVTMCPPLSSQMLKAAGLHAGPMVKITLPLNSWISGACAKTPMQEESKWIIV